MTRTSFSERDHLIARMREALAQEIESARTSGRAKHTAINGKLMEQRGNAYLYSFTLEEPWETQDDAPLSPI